MRSNRPNRVASRFRFRFLRKQTKVGIGDGSSVAKNVLFQLGTTVREAIKLVNATLNSRVTVVEALSMSEVMEAGSIEKAQSLGLMRRLRFRDEVEDGDLLILTPGRFDEAAESLFPCSAATGLSVFLEITGSAAISVSTPASTGLSAPIGEEGICIGILSARIRTRLHRVNRTPFRADPSVPSRAVF